MHTMVGSKIEIGYGSAQGEQSFETGRNAALQAVAGVHRHPVSAAVVFVSSGYDLGEVLRGIRAVVAVAPILGTTTAGEICNEHLQGSVVVTLLASPYVKVRCGLGRAVSGDYRQAVREVIGAPCLQPYFNDVDYWNELTLKGVSVFGMLFSPGNTRYHASKSHEILEELKNKSLGRLPIFGGSAADNWRMEENHVLSDQAAYPDSMLLAVFETQLQFGIAMGHGFVPTEARATVTSACGQEVRELDGEPALDVYARITGSSPAELLGKHLTLATGHTMGVADPNGQFGINVASYATPDGGINLTQPVVGGTVLTVMKPGRSRTPIAGREALRKGIMRGGISAPALSLVAYCALIEKVSGYPPAEEIRTMKSVLAGSPLVGFCSFGEQGVADDGISRHNNSVISVLVLGSDLSAEAKVALENARLLSHLEERVRERTAELSNANRLLQQEIAERKRAEAELRDQEELLRREIVDRRSAQGRLSAKQRELEELNYCLEARVEKAVAELRLKDQVMITQSRQAAMGEMIGNIAHQWRQPLNALGLLLANIEDAFYYGELNETYIKQSMASGNRLIQKMSSTINDVRNFFHPGKESTVFSAHRQIDEAIALVASSFKNDSVQIRLDASADISLYGFPNEYSQVLLNLFSNAKDAIKAGEVSGGRIEIYVGTSEGMGCVRVRDNGGGIPADCFDRIFEPYYSTKKMGTGVGLYMSKMIIERNMNGSIEARNIDGGAEFTVITPLAKEPDPVAIGIGPPGDARGAARYQADFTGLDL